MTTTTRTSSSTMPTTLTAGFTTIAMFVSGVLSAVFGFVALQRADYITSQLVYENTDFWGWAFLVLGAITVLLAIRTMLTGTSAGGLATLAVTLTTIGWVFALFATPIVAIAGVALSLYVLRDLAVAPR